LLLEPVDVVPKTLGGMLGAMALLLPAAPLGLRALIGGPLIGPVHAPRVPPKQATDKPRCGVTRSGRPGSEGLGAQDRHGGVRGAVAVGVEGPGPGIEELEAGDVRRTVRVVVHR
jgi:hypothetical protein